MDELAKQFADLAAKYGPATADAAMIPQLDPADHQILGFLSEHGGWTAGDIARHMGSLHVRREAQLLRPKLLLMETLGLVGKLVDNKPVAWVRTAAGTKIVTSAKARPSNGVTTEHAN